MIENLAIGSLLVVASLRLYVPPKTAANVLFASLLLLVAALITFTLGSSR